MTKEEIYKKIESLYNSEKGKGFITHLLRSYFPVENAKFLFEDVEAAKMVCCITGEKLSSRSGQFSKMFSSSELMFADFMEGAKKAIAGQTHERSAELTQKIEEAQALKIAITSPKSDKLLSPDAFEQLSNFYFTSLMQGNKHLNWIASNERAKQTVQHFQKKGVEFTPKEKEIVHQSIETSRTGNQLGDFEALQKLKAKLEGK